MRIKEEWTVAIRRLLHKTVQQEKMLLIFIGHQPVVDYAGCSVDIIKAPTHMHVPSHAYARKRVVVIGDECKIVRNRDKTTFYLKKRMKALPLRMLERAFDQIEDTSTNIRVELIQNSSCPELRKVLNYGEVISFIAIDF